MIHLPDELILHIISYLEPAELVNLQHVSRAFLSLSRDNNLWKSLCFSHSAAERRRRRLDVTPPDIDPRLAELIRAADTLSNTFDTSVHDTDAPSADVQQQRNAGRRRQALIANWDPSYPDERVNWYDDFIQRHAEPRLSWFQDAGTEGREHGDVRREATGAGVLFDQHGLADKLVAPLDDGRICIWDASAASDRQGTMIAKSDIGLLANRGSDLDYDTRLAQSHAIMTETGAVECVSIDSKLAKGFFAVKNELVETDLNTLQVVSRTPYPFPITALSEAHHSTPLTIGTNWTLHLHDSRKPPVPPSSSSVRCELISGPADNDFSRLDTGDLHGHVSLSQPGALSILHLPTTREWDGNGDIWVAGRFTSMLNFDRRYFPRLRGTVHSGARLSCLAALPHPFVPHHLRLGTPYANPSLLHDVKSTRGFTLIAAGEYKGKGSLELYGLSGEPERSINSSDSRTTTSGGRGGRSKAYYQNRQTASSSKLLSVAPHGTRLVFADGNGGLKWVERDGSTPVRQLNINDFQQRSKVGSVSTLEQQHDHGNLVNATPDSEASWGDIVQKILPTTTTTTTTSLQYAPESTESFSSSLGLNNLVLWTGDGRLGLLGFGKEPPMARDVFEDALEVQGESMEQGGQHQGDKVRERQYGVEMRRALEQQARELRWLRGYGL
jgi:hypothetical protein